MTGNDLIATLAEAKGPLLLVGLGLPVVLLVWGRLLDSPRTSRAFGWVTSSVVALGLVALALDLAAIVYIAGQRSLLDEPLVPLATPLWFGLGSLWAGTRRVPFQELRRYPLLRRVWATLSLVVLVLVAFAVLKRTYLVVFTGIMGFVVLAIVVWTLGQKLFVRMSAPPPEGGDPDLVDDVADAGKRRLARLAAKIAAPPEDE